MRARHAICPALLSLVIPLAGAAPTPGDGPPPSAKAPAPAKPRKADAALVRAQAPAAPAPTSQGPAVKQEPSPPPKGDSPDEAPAPAGPPPIAPGTPAEANRTRLGVDARLRELDAADPKRENPALKPIREALDRRLVLLNQWVEANRQKAEALDPKPSPEQLAGEAKADLDRTRSLLDQAGKAPDGLLPEAFGPLPPGAQPKTGEVHLVEMKEAIDRARAEGGAHANELDKARGDGTKPASAEGAALRAEREKAHQSLAALAAARAEREAAITNAASPEARDLARERYANYEWECRVEAERLAASEARIALAGRRADLVAAQVQARVARLQLDRRLLEVMEQRYALQSEKQQRDLQRAVAKEETRAAHTDDILERYRAQRSAQLLELEAQAVAYEKANATTIPGLSFAEQERRADKTLEAFVELKQRVTDGTVSSLDVLRLKNEFRRLGPLRAAIVGDELAKIKAALAGYETALAGIEMDLINDARDDRYDRDALIEKLPPGRRDEADAMLEGMEVRHRDLLRRCRDVLQKLAQGAEDTQAQIVRRIHILDEQYAFVRTHIFWVRDAEPIGPATLARAKDEAVRTAWALGKLACQPWDRGLWGRVSPDFVAALVGLIVLPWPLRLVQKAMDRLRLAAPTPSIAPEGAPGPRVG